MATTVSPSFIVPPTAAPNQHPYTCNTCQVAFRGSELQRSHMQSDWHRYNLKRRVASLPPLTSEVFADKVLANQATAAATAARASFEKVCTVCQRTYFSENAYQNHLGSQKHRARLAEVSAAPPSTITDDETASMMSSAFSLGEPIETMKPVDPAADEEFSKVVDSLKLTTIDGEDPLPGRPSRPVHSAQESRPEHPLSPTTPIEATAAVEDDKAVDTTLKCLFCNLASTSIESNVMHMQSKHGMFIPEKSYLVDLSGLVSWLHDRVHALHECLFCGQIKYTASGIQTHMRDKGHCMIAFESEADMVEVGQFYDFRSTYSDDESDEDVESDADADAKTSGGKLGIKRTTQIIVDGEEEAAEDEEEWESEGEDDEGASSSGTQTPRQEHQRQPPPQTLAYQDSYELHLPSGRTAGHRSLARYYRQNLHNYPTPAERASRLLLTEGDEDATEQRGRRGQHQQLTVSRANGGLGLMGAPEHKKKEAAAIELKDKRRTQRALNRYQAGNEKQNNSQKHFRDPLLQ